MDQAKTLDTLGISGMPLFAYYEGYRTPNPDEQPVIITALFDEGAYEEVGIAPAFTVAELGVMLGRLRHNPMGENEAAARADFLIRRLETGKVTAEECNQRLLNS